VTSQPFILSTILNIEFSNSIRTNEFNLKTVFPTLKNIFDKVGYIHPSNSNRQKSILGVYFNDEEIQSLNSFVEMDFTIDFYQNIVESGNIMGYNLTRNQVKSGIMNYLFNTNESQREQSKVIYVLERKYPGVSRFIVEFINVWGSSYFSLLLQRTESFLILRSISQKILHKYPEIPIFTIHDSILTLPQYNNIVKQIIVEEMVNITGKNVGLKSNNLLLEIENIKDVIIQKSLINSRNQVDKYSKTWYKKNVKLGFDFLFPNGDNEIENFISTFYK
jgi:hypothetical protein